MKSLSKTIFFVFLSINLLGQDIPKNSIISLDSKEYTQEELSNGIVVFLVSSLTCGYCLNEIPFFNHLAETYTKQENIRFIVLLENKSKYINEYKSNDNLFYNQYWTIIPKSLPYIKKIWQKKTFPEYHIFINGKLKKSFAYANKITRQGVSDYLKSL